MDWLFEYGIWLVFLVTLIAMQLGGKEKEGGGVVQDADIPKAAVPDGQDKSKLTKSDRQ